MPAAEHAQVLRETKASRNAHARARRKELARAWAWCDHFGAQVGVDPDRLGGPLYVVRIPCFHEAVDARLELAVAHLHAHVAWWCDGPAQLGPTKGDLTSTRARLAAWRGLPDGR